MLQCAWTALGMRLFVRQAKRGLMKPQHRVLIETFYDTDAVETATKTAKTTS
jgi:hypothetical protein